MKKYIAFVYVKSQEQRITFEKLLKNLTDRMDFHYLIRETVKEPYIICKHGNFDEKSIGILERISS